MSEKTEFCSDAWFDMAIGTLAELIREQPETVAGLRISVSETFTDPPTHLRQAGLCEAAWSFVIEHGVLTAAKRSDESASYRVRADYNATLPRVSMEISDIPEEAEAYLRLRDEAMAAGKIARHGTLDTLPPAAFLMLRELHNRIARRTL